MTLTLKKIYLIVLGITIGAGSLVMAANVWQGTSQIADGQIISAETIQDNFDYLYARMNTIPVCMGTSSALGWDGSDWLCLDHTPVVPPTPVTEDLVFNQHTFTQCRDAGGEVVYDSQNRPFCRMNGGACQSGWSHHEQWTSTTANTCTGSSNCHSRDSCTTGAHVWANARAEQCQVTNYFEGGGLASSCDARGTSNCLASVSRVGCY